MDWNEAVTLGAIGGALVESIKLYSVVTSWQESRHKARKDGGSLPALANFVDGPADGLAAITRLTLGAIAGLIFHAQITGVEAAVAIGASAPAILGSIGSAQNLRDALTYGTDRDQTSVNEEPLEDGRSKRYRLIDGDGELEETAE